MSDRIYVYACLAHYADHMLPIVDELRDRGHDVEVFTSQRNAAFGTYRHRAKLDPSGLWIIAGSADLDVMNKEGRRFVYVEHGAGQTYDADERGLHHASYSTGRIEGNVAAFLCPNEYVTRRRMRTHPEVPAWMVGVPKLDHLHAHATGFHDGVESNVVAFAWHWNCQLLPETMSAWEHYRSSMVRIVLGLHRRGFKVVGHAHPRIARQLRYHTERMGMEWWDAEDVLTRAALLVWDNTSLGYEFASLDRPTVILNAPWYRRHVHHGSRFWECLPGEVVDEPDQVIDAVTVALADNDASLRECIDVVYPLRDGRAAKRAANAIERLL